MCEYTGSQQANLKAKRDLKKKKKKLKVNTTHNHQFTVGTVLIGPPHNYILYCKYKNLIFSTPRPTERTFKWMLID